MSDWRPLGADDHGGRYYAAPPGTAPPGDRPYASARYLQERLEGACPVGYTWYCGLAGLPAAQVERALAQLPPPVLAALYEAEAATGATAGHNRMCARPLAVGMMACDECGWRHPVADRVIVVRPVASEPGPWVHARAGCGQGWLASQPDGYRFTDDPAQVTCPACRALAGLPGALSPSAAISTVTIPLDQADPENLAAATGRPWDSPDADVIGDLRAARGPAPDAVIFDEPVGVALHDAPAGGIVAVQLYDDEPRPGEGVAGSRRCPCGCGYATDSTGYAETHAAAGRYDEPGIAASRRPGPLASLPGDMLLTVAAGPGLADEAWRMVAAGTWIAGASEPTADLTAENLTADALTARLARLGRLDDEPDPEPPW